MSELDDHQLLAEFARDRSEIAFTALVQRHVNLVYSTALRSTGNNHAAEEITQAAFIILARKANGFSRKIVISGWLYQTTRMTSANFLRGEIRRQQREQEAYMQSTLNGPATEAWPQIAPLLDDALDKLGEADRNAIVLRFFENKNLREVGTALGASEDAAKMRVNRALEKLRKFFTKRGVTLSALAIAGAVSANSVQAAPAGLVATLTAAAKGAAVSSSTLTLIKGALKIMAWTKMKTAVITGTIVLLAAGTTTITVREIQGHRTYPWQVEGHDSRVLDRQPPQVRVLPSKARFGSWGTSRDKNGEPKFMGTGVPAETVVLNAYNFAYPIRVTGLENLPKGKFDYIACLPSGNEEALKKEVKKKLGVVARLETTETDVLRLEVLNPNAAGLKPSPASEQTGGSTREDGAGEWSWHDSPLSSLAAFLEEYLQTPVIEQTGLVKHFDITLKWKQSDWGKRNPDGLKQALRDQLGLELVSSREPIEMLVVEKVK